MQGLWKWRIIDKQKKEENEIKKKNAVENTISRQKPNM